MDKRLAGHTITINDIADALGVSKTTVSRVISGKGRIGAETRKRVQEYIDMHGYQPNLIAKSLAESKTFNIGVVLPSDDNSAEMPFFQKCLMGASELATSQDYDIVVITSDDEDTSQLERVIRNKKVDGIILTRVLVNDKCVQILKQHDIPFVVVGSFHDSEVVQIDHNHKRAAIEMAGEMLRDETRAIAFVGENLDSVVNLNRYQGYVDALTAQEIKVDNELVYFVDNRVDIDKAVAQIIQAGAEGILCMDDFVCINVMTALKKRGLAVPQDVKVASLYNSVYLSNHLPPVSAVDFDVDGLGATACQILLNMLAGQEVEHRTLLDYKLLMRESTMTRI